MRGSAGISGAPAQVVIVDDDHTMRYILRREFRKRDPVGFRWDIATAATPEEGLALVDATDGSRALFLLTDHDLRAAMDGADLIGAVRRVRPDAVCVLFSGHPRSAIADAIERARPTAFLEKPPRIASLVADLVPLIPAELPADGDPAVDAASTDTASPGEVPSFAEPDMYRAIVDSVHDAIFMLDPEGRVVTWSRGSERMLGYRDEEVLGAHFSIFHTPNDVANHRPRFELNVAAQDGQFEDAGWRVRKDGSMFWANVVMTAIQRSDRGLAGFSMVTRDLTERRHHEEALRQSEERYRLLVESVKDYAIIQLDPSGRVASWNEGAKEIKGYTAEEIIGTHVSRFYTDEARANAKPQENLRLAATHGRHEEEGWRVRKGGSRFWASAVTTALIGSAGELAGFSKVTRDLTARKRDEEAMRTRTGELAELTRELEAFNYTVAHDLRAPLRAVLHLTEVLGASKDDMTEKERREILDAVHASALRMSQLVEDLLALSQVTTSEISREPVDVTGMAETVFQDVLGHDATGIPEFHVEPDLATEGDARMIRIVLENLISNAVKFSRKASKPSIRVGGTDAGGVPAFFVADNGVGFDAAESDRLFRPFQRMHGPNEFEGTGIGLATVARVVERHGGRVWADARPGEGATFYFTLAEGSGRGDASAGARANAAR